MSRKTNHFKMHLCACAFAVFGGTVFAGDGNQIYILQQNTSGFAIGNTLEVDQSQASGSIVAGTFDPVTDGAPQPALQDGINNIGRLVISGNAGQAVLLQSGTGNDASLTLSGALGMAALEQSGISNIASLTVEGNDAKGIIQQDGNRNDGQLTVSGAGASGKLVQQGNDNQFGFSVIGPNASGTYTAIGNNMTPAGAAPMVISNGGSVTITQTQLRSN